ncbi:MAG: hypothetical protein EA351_09285 [Gemmatimonadales bacterium]|nr:MAG: hypothetical protein EA351_09285 [Gemmatimonadales bacterium]
MTAPNEKDDVERGGEASELPPPPSIWSFAERGPGRMALEAALGGAAGYLLATPLGLEELRLSLALLGAVAAPLSLTLTPLEGPPAYRAMRYGMALAVILTLVVSFAGQGRERPIGELLYWGAFFFIIGAIAHGALALTLDRGEGR